MSLRLAAIVPHPPIALPDIGGPESLKMAETEKAMRLVSRQAREEGVTRLVCMSPHHQFYGPSFVVVSLGEMGGDFGRFGFPGISYEVAGDPGFAEAIGREAAKEDLPIDILTRESPDAAFRLDHGFLVPFSFIGASSETRVVEISIADQPLERHYRFGTSLGRAFDSSSEKVLFMASGDLSHRLTRGAPAGYSPGGRDFDKLVVEMVSLGNFRDIMHIPAALVEEAGECGLRSVITLAGILEGRNFGSRVLSYEAPFGVGYMTALVSFT